MYKDCESEVLTFDKRFLLEDLADRPSGEKVRDLDVEHNRFLYVQ